MNTRLRPGWIGAFVFVLGSVGLAGVPAATADPPTTPGRDFGLSHRPVCPDVPNAFHCHAHVVTNAGGTPLATGSYLNGYAPADLALAYNLPATGGADQTVAIVDAYDNPNAYADLIEYRRQFGLPACTTDTGCFRKVNQRGGSTALVTKDVGWGQEIALDLDMVSATCPGCKILLVEADSNSFADLGAAVTWAATTGGANAISNSYGAREFRGETSYEGPYNHPGVAITVSSGDSGYGVEFPAASQYVTAVGGTRLTKSSTTPAVWTETVWSGAGSGCSAYVPKPIWQTDKAACGRRTVADVAAVADPATGVAVYDSYGSSTAGNWFVFGGTSVAAPIIAGVYGLAGNADSVIAGSYSYPYSHTASLYPGSLNDITSGSNGRCAKAKLLCTGVVGYDGPTGNGTPNGVGAF